MIVMDDHAAAHTKFIVAVCLLSGICFNLTVWTIEFAPSVGFGLIL